MDNILTEQELFFSNPQILKIYKEHIREALQRRNYPTWALNKLKIKNNKYNTNIPIVKTNLAAIKKKYQHGSALH